MWWTMLLGCGGGSKGCPERTMLDDGECVYDEIVCERQGKIVVDGRCVCDDGANLYPYGDGCRHKNDDVFVDTDTDVDTDSDSDIDTDIDVDTDYPPTLVQADWRFSFDADDVFTGVELLIEASDLDLENGWVLVSGAPSVPWNEVIPVVGSFYRVPLDLEIGDPCSAATSHELQVTLEDAAGNHSATVDLTVRWTPLEHSEVGISGPDACEPCLAGLTTDQLPLVACGQKRPDHGYDDLYDAISIEFPAGWGEVEATANYAAGSDPMRFRLTHEPDFGFELAATDPLGVGQRLQTTVVGTPTQHHFSIDAPAFPHSSSDWVVFLQPALP